MEKKKKETEDNVQELVATAQEGMLHNLRFYSQACEVPKDALKEIKAGRLKGMSDVNPMWRMKRMTEIFGPVGFGWKYVIDKQWTEAYGNEVKCFCNVFLYIRDPETREWSEPIPGCGGSAIVSMEKNGAYVNDEGYKMALTDALSIAMKPLGIGGNIWYGPKATGHNESKYEQASEPYYGQPQQQSQQSYQVFSGGQLQQALAELANVKDENGFNALWSKWAAMCPAITKNGTEFYNKAVEKITEIRLNPKK